MSLASNVIVNNVFSSTVKHHQYKQALEFFVEIMEFTEIFKKQQGLLLVGPSGSGKTRLAEAMALLYPPIQEPERTRISVVHISMPANPTIISVCKLLLDILGQRYTSRASEGDLTAQVKTILKKTGACMLIIDEAQHLVDGSKRNKPTMVADWLKQLMNDVHISITLIGIPRIEVLMHSNEQFRRRFSRTVHLTGFKADSEEDLNMLNNVVAKLIKDSGYEGNTEYIHCRTSLEMLYFSTNGRISYIASIIAEALRLAVNSASTQLTSEHFSIAFRNVVWANSVDKNNPFSGKFPPRNLTQRGEPFYEEVI